MSLLYALFPLALVISGVSILYAVLKLVAGMRIVIVMAMMLRTVTIARSAPVLSRNSYNQTGDSQYDDLKVEYTIVEDHDTRICY